MFRRYKQQHSFLHAIVRIAFKISYMENSITSCAKSMRKEHSTTFFKKFIDCKLFFFTN